MNKKYFQTKIDSNLYLLLKAYTTKKQKSVESFVDDAFKFYLGKVLKVETLQDIEDL